MRIKEVSKLTGLSEKTIRYYESRGLVVPDMAEKNGRQWRDYSEADAALLNAVATLRRACFHVEEIDTIRQNPGAIPETLKVVRERVEETYAALTQLRETLKTVESAPDLVQLADRLSEAAEPLELPEPDVKFNFRKFDRLMSEEREKVNSAPSLPRFGWVSIYSGRDEKRFQEVQAKLAACGVEYRSSSYTKGSRLVVQGMANTSSSFEYSRGPTAKPYGLQESLLGDERMNSYSVEVRKRDEERARRALRTTS